MLMAFVDYTVLKVCKYQEMKQSEPKSSPQITKITNSQNTKRLYGQPSEQLFPKRWPLSNPNRTKNINTRKVKRHQNSDTKKGNRGSQQNYRLGTVSEASTFKAGT